MSSLKRVLVNCLLGIAATILRADPPPNDNFADRIVLSGTSITFTGTLAGATAEWIGDWFEPNGYPFTCCSPGAPSVWWEWTTPESSAVTLLLEPIGSSVQSFVINGLA